MNKPTEGVLTNTAIPRRRLKSETLTMASNSETNGVPNGHRNGSTAPPLPQARPVEYAPKQTLLPPLSRRGVGPGLIVVLSADGSLPAPDNVKIENGVPSTLTKWAEEGYTVVELQAGLESLKSAISAALNELRRCTSCEPKEAVGLVNYDPSAWPKLAAALEAFPTIVGAVTYADSADNTIDVPFPVPSVHHLAGKATNKLPRTSQLTGYDYPTLKSYNFAVPFTSSFDYANEAVSHTRNLTFLKKLMNGPYFDLEAIWDEHTYYEFENRSVKHTMATMVQEPYVNHVPTVSCTAQVFVPGINVVAAYRRHWTSQAIRLLSR